MPSDKEIEVALGVWHGSAEPEYLKMGEALRAAEQVREPKAAPPPDPLHNLIDTIFALQSALRNIGVGDPVIELASWEDGQKMRWLWEHHAKFLTIEFREPLGPANEINVAGVIIRWPAIPLRRNNGEVEFL